jgi:hypothetical protein
MKWVTLPAEALKAGMELQESITRSIEVAALAPMLTRSPGDERATGMAIASSRAMTAAESYSLRWSSSAGRAYAMLGIARDGYLESDPPRLMLSHDFGIAEESRESARLLADLYLRGRAEPEMFWGEMRRFGVVGEGVDAEAMARWSETHEDRDKRLDRDVEKAKVIAALAKEGWFSGTENRVRVYRALKGLGVLPGDFDAEKAAASEASPGAGPPPAEPPTRPDPPVSS